MVDTGASKTVLNSALADEFIERISVDEFTGKEMKGSKIESAGIVPGDLNFQYGLVKSFLVGSLLVENYKIALLDLTHINKLYEKLNKINILGLLGSDFLKKYNAVIDFKNKIIVLEHD